MEAQYQHDDIGRRQGNEVLALERCDDPFDLTARIMHLRDLLPGVGIAWIARVLFGFVPKVGFLDCKEGEGWLTDARDVSYKVEIGAKNRFPARRHLPSTSSSSRTGLEALVHTNTNTYTTSHWLFKTDS